MASTETDKSLTSQIATGAMFTTIAMVINRASGMFLQMILVRMITVDEFGLFKLAIELSSFGIMFVSFFVGGTSAGSTTRVVTVRMSAGDHRGIRSAIQTSVISVTGMAVGLAVLAFTLIPPLLEHVFQIRQELLPEAIAFFRWFLLYIFLSCTSMVFSAALRSCDFFKAFSVTESITNLLRLILIPLLVYLGSGLNGIVWGFSAALLAGIIPALWILETFTHCLTRGPGDRKTMMVDLKDLTTFGIPVFLSSLSSTVYYSADTLILGYYMPVKFVGIYSAGVVLVHSLLYLFSGLETALFPILSASLAQKEEGREGRILDRGYRLLCLIAFPTGVYSFVMAPYMIRFLFGPDYLEAVMPARMLAILIIAWAAMPASVMFMSTGRPEINARLGIISAILNIVLNFSLIPLLGIIGAAVSSAVSRLYSEIEGIRICKKLFGASFPWGYAGRILVLSACPAVLILPVFWVLPVSGSFLQTLLILVVTGAIYGLCVAPLLLRSSLVSNEDRLVIEELLRKEWLRPVRNLLGVN